MNNLDWIDVVKLTIMTALPLGLRLAFSKRHFKELLQDKKQLLKIIVFWMTCSLLILGGIQLMM